MVAAARVVAARDGVRGVTLTSIAAEVGLHKSALLRYFETRELILLRLAADEWQAWSKELSSQLATARGPGAAAVCFAATLTDRPLFCDLLAHVALHLERNVSLESVREYKLVTRSCIRLIGDALRETIPFLDSRDLIDLMAVVVSTTGTMWQMANPGPELAALYRDDPRLEHASVDLEAALTRILTALLRGMADRQ